MYDRMCFHPAFLFGNGKVVEDGRFHRRRVFGAQGVGLVVGLLRGVKKCEERVSVREKEKRERERDIDRTNARRTHHHHHPLTRCVLQREGEKRHRTLKTHSVLLNPTSKANPFADRKNNVVVVETNDNTATKTPRRTKNMTTNERTTTSTILDGGDVLTTSRCFFPQRKKRGFDSSKRKKKEEEGPISDTHAVLLLPIIRII